MEKEIVAIERWRAMRVRMLLALTALPRSVATTPHPLFAWLATCGTEESIPIELWASCCGDGIGGYEGKNSPFDLSRTEHVVPTIAVVGSLVM